MYVTDFVCTYKDHDLADQDDVFRAQFLQAFGLETWDDAAIEKSTNELFEKVKDLPEMDVVFSKLKLNKSGSMFVAILGDSQDVLFRILFCFDLFDVAHRCLCDLLQDGEMKSENRDKLLNNL